MSDRTTFAALIARKVPTDRRGLETEDFIDAAVRTYERFRPRLATVAVTGNATHTYACATTFTDPAWAVGFSEVRTIEYPDGEDPPEYLERDDWALVNTADVSSARRQSLYIYPYAPAATETFTVTYTARHTVSASVSTIPGEDEEAVADLGAAALMEELAARYDDLTAGPDLPADFVATYVEKATAARTNARAARARARTMLGLPADSRGDFGANGVAVTDFDMRLHGGRGGLTHSRRDR
jgi:hypothetical protein